MDWWHKTIHHASASLNIAPKSAESGSSRKGKGGGGGLVKLRDDVQSCGYEDVEVMWNILNASVPKEAGVAAPKTRRGRFKSTRSVLLFWSRHSKTHKTSTASSCASVSSSSSSSSSCCFSG